MIAGGHILRPTRWPSWPAEMASAAHVRRRSCFGSAEAETAVGCAHLILWQIPRHAQSRRGARGPRETGTPSPWAGLMLSASVAAARAGGSHRLSSASPGHRPGVTGGFGYDPRVYGSVFRQRTGEDGRPDVGNRQVSKEHTSPEAGFVLFASRCGGRVSYIQALNTAGECSAPHNLINSHLQLLLQTRSLLLRQHSVAAPGGTGSSPPPGGI